MSSENLGNHLNRIVYSARDALFEQGELFELTYGAFNISVMALQASEEETITIDYPVGLRADRSHIRSRRVYPKNELIDRYRMLAFVQLPVNAIIKLVTIVEAMLGDVVRPVVRKFPNKLGTKTKLSMQLVLEATSIQEIHLRATDALLNELSYKSPTEFAEAVKELLSINLLECPGFHKYLELKACRDIWIHNHGQANETYVRKSGSHVRAKPGERLPVTIDYFLESYEACLQVTEWLEKTLHEQWYSSEFDERTKPSDPMSQPSPPTTVHSDQLEVPSLIQPAEPST